MNAIERTLRDVVIANRILALNRWWTPMAMSAYVTRRAGSFFLSPLGQPSHC